MNVGSVKLPQNNEIDQISEEIDKGLTDSTAIRKFLEKRIQIEEEYAKNLQKLCKSQPNLKKMGGITSAFAVIVENINQYSSHLLQIVQKINVDVNEPLNTFIKDLKSEHKTYVSDGQDLAKERKGVFESLKNSKSNYDSVFKDPESDPSKIGAAEDEYRQQISIANKYEALFHTEKLPKIQNDIQRLETIRMQKMKTNLKKFITEFESSPVKFTQTLKESEDIINAIDTKHDIMAFVNFNKSVNNPTAEFVFEACEKEKKKKGWRSTISVLGINIGGSSSGGGERNINTNYKGGHHHNNDEDDDHRHPNAVFNIPITDVMRKQKSKYPDLDVPYVLVLLVNLIKRNDGFKTEGIFRIPGHNEVISQLKKQINEGDYSIKETNVHALASLLKLWLREMPQPLIPDSLYESSVNCQTTQDIVEIFKQLPTINQKIVAYIVSFLLELISPENVTISKMNLDNISMVYAPSFLRCNNPELLLTNVEKEKSFIKTLIESSSQLLELSPLNLIDINDIDDSSQQQQQQPTFNIPPAIVHLPPQQPIVKLQQQQQPTTPPPPIPINKKPPVPSSPVPTSSSSISLGSSANSTPTNSTPTTPTPTTPTPTTPTPIHQRIQVLPPLIPNARPLQPPPPPSSPSIQPIQSNNPIPTPISPISSSLSLSGGGGGGGGIGSPNQNNNPIPIPLSLSSKSTSSNSLLGLSSPSLQSSPQSIPKSSMSSLNLSSGSNGSSPNSPNLIKKSTVRPVLPPPSSLTSHLHGTVLPQNSNPLLVHSFQNKTQETEREKIDQEAMEIIKSMKLAKKKQDSLKLSSLPPPPPSIASDQQQQQQQIPPPTNNNISSPNVGTRSFLNKVQLPPPPSTPK